MMRNSVARSSRWLTGMLFLLAAGFLFVTAPSSLAAGGPETCSENAGSRQLDFWVGKWTVTYPGMPGGANSIVRLELDKCMIVESWDSGKGHWGENMLAYSSDDKKWHGMFADNQGRVHVFEGKAADGSAEFLGPSVGPKEEAELNRIKVVRLTADKVEQSWEKSRDGGATWKLEFRGEYSRKKSR